MESSDTLCVDFLVTSAAMIHLMQQLHAVDNRKITKV